MERKTKIIATLGPAVDNPAQIAGLVEAGMDVARMNFSHGTADRHKLEFEWVLDAARQAGRAVTVLQDIQGPKIRVGTFPNGEVTLEAGDEVRLRSGDETAQPGEVFICYLDRVRDLKPGMNIQLADGQIVLEVTRIQGVPHAKVVSGGVLKSRQGAAFAGADVDLPAVTEKDIEDLATGVEFGVDMVAASFVGSAADIRQVRELAEGVPVIAKLERAVAYDNLDEIIDEADGVMVARGDLGVEFQYPMLPRIQKDIITRTNKRGKLSITATEMLESMKDNYRPTRAEVTDVANAVFDGTDAVMLSAESAVGRYPIRSVEVMDVICREAEKSLDLHGMDKLEFISHEAEIPSAVTKAAVEVAQNLGIPLIACFTESGTTPRLLSKYRPQASIVAFTNRQEAYRRMALYWGVQPRLLERHDSTDELIVAAGRELVAEGLARTGDPIVMVAGIPPNRGASTNLVQIHRIAGPA
jgi:pyruvate kinase